MVIHATTIMGTNKVAIQNHQGTRMSVGEAPAISASLARLLVLTSAVLWSTSGAFVKVLDLPPAVLAMYRTLFAGGLLGLIFFLAGGRPQFHRAMIPMGICFAVMNYLFVAATDHTTAANAIFLQYTAPIWVSLGSVWILREAMDGRTLVATLGTLVGVGVIVAGNWSSSNVEKWGIAFGLTSGFFFAGVILSMRHLRMLDSMWLTVWNLCSAGILLALWNGVGVTLGWLDGKALMLPADPGKLTGLALFGVFQMGLPYILFGWGLRGIGAPEAGLLLLLEPILNPLWAYLIAQEVPIWTTVVGGTLLLAILGARSAADLWRSSKNRVAIAAVTKIKPTAE